MYGAKVSVNQGRAMRVDNLLNSGKGVGFVLIVLGVLIRQHDETFMVIDSSKCAKIERAFVASIKLRQPDEE